MGTAARNDEKKKLVHHLHLLQLWIHNPLKL